MSETLDAAIGYLRREWTCIPICPHTKKPLVSWKNGDPVDRPDRTPEQLERWWSRWPDAMVGVLTGPDSGVFVLDVDTAAGGHTDGSAALRALESEYEPLNHTLEAQTPSGGRHLVYEYPSASESYIPSKAHALGPGVDVKGRGGFFIAPPSVRAGGGQYQWLDESEPIEVPNEWVTQKIARKVREDGEPATGNEAKSTDVARFINELEDTPPAIEGVGGDEHTYRVCARAAIDYQLSTDQFLVASADWNSRCNPPWDTAELIRKFENAEQYGTGQPGSALPDLAVPSGDERFNRFSIGAISRDPATFAPVDHIPTGMSALDNTSGLGGLRTKGVTLACGKPGEGKSTFVAQVAANAAEAGHSVGFISLELDGPDVFRLMVSQHARIPRWKLAANKTDNSDNLKYRTTMEAIDGWPLDILDSRAWSGALDRHKLKTIVANGVRARGWRLVVLDYLGLLAPVAGENSFQTDTENSTAIKNLARDLDIALLVVSAMRKSASFYGTKNKPSSVPTLDEVTGAGRLVYDATNVLFVHSEIDEQRTNDGCLHLHCLKSRYSGMAKSKRPTSLKWLPQSGAITNDVFNYSSDEDAA